MAHVCASFSLTRKEVQKHFTTHLFPTYEMLKRMHEVLAIFTVPHGAKILGDA